MDDLPRGIHVGGTKRLKQRWVPFAPKDPKKRRVPTDRSELDRDVHILVAEAPGVGEDPSFAAGFRNGPLLEEAENPPFASLLEALMNAIGAAHIDRCSFNRVIARPNEAMPAFRTVVVLNANA